MDCPIPAAYDDIMDNNNDNDAVMDDDDDQDRLTPRNMEVDVPKSDSMSFATSTSASPHNSEQITNDFEESLRDDFDKPSRRS